MKFFLDENLPLSALDLFHSLGHEAEHARSSPLRGASDQRIATHAKKANAILVTKDLEFGSTSLYPHGTHYGLIILRLPNTFTATQQRESLKNFLSSIDLNTLTNSLVVVEPGRYRIRRIE